MANTQDLIDLLDEHTEAWNSHDLDRLMKLFAEDAVFEASGGSDVSGTRFEGFDDVRDAFAGVFAEMPDAHWGGGRHYVMAPEYGVSQWTLTGTLPDGSRLEVNGCDFIRVRDGKIVLKNAYRKRRPPIPPA